MTQERVKAILDALAAAYPDAECALHHQNVFELLVAVVLSAQTTDKSVNEVTPALFAAYPDAAALAVADPQDVEEKIRRIGMYRMKAKNIVGLARKLQTEYGGVVPQDFTALTSLPGVGRKTANVVLSVGFGEQHIAVDTHVFRVSNRIGLVREKDVLATEEALMRTIPQERWSHAHHLLIFHGRNCCTAKKPACKNCCLQGLCEQQL
ncbi:MAG: endonuclease III [Clostridia bacterium]|nr:endonuclease III [Clostridia bacterium]